MTKIPYVVMGVKISISTSTMQHPAPKLSKVHLNILNLKNKNKANFLCILWNLLLYFQCALGLMKIITKSNKPFGTCYLYKW